MLDGGEPPKSKIVKVNVVEIFRPPLRPLFFIIAHIFAHKTFSPTLLTPSTGQAPTDEFSTTTNTYVSTATIDNVSVVALANVLTKCSFITKLLTANASWLFT